jgi:hypothetical protein
LHEESQSAGMKIRSNENDFMMKRVCENCC